MSSANGIVRFCLFAAVIGLIGVGVYANSLNTKLAQRDATVTALTTDRDAWKAKFEAEEKKVAESATALQQEQAKVHDLEAQLEAAKKPSTRKR